MFKDKIKTWITSLIWLCCLYCWLGTDFTTLSSFFIVYFEHVLVCWNIIPLGNCLVKVNNKATRTTSMDLFLVSMWLAFNRHLSKRISVIQLSSLLTQTFIYWESSFNFFITCCSTSHRVFLVKQVHSHRRCKHGYVTVNLSTFKVVIAIFMLAISDSLIFWFSYTSGPPVLLCQQVRKDSNRYPQ